MKTARRTFIQGVAAGAAAWTLPASAQQQPDAGIDYRVLDTPQPVEPGKIEVIEFFWYGCPHCNAFQPALYAWLPKLGQDVQFRRLPAPFNPTWAQHAKLHYALAATGDLARLHRKVFESIHADGLRLGSDGEAIEWAARNGVDREKFSAALISGETADKIAAAFRLLQTYRIDGVPALAVAGKFVTAPSVAGSHERCLQVVDFLIDAERRKNRRA
jgi:thiol:disulfide interchange protein DsbA